jgi:hypothetical protein
MMRTAFTLLLCSNRVIAYRRVARFLARTLGPGTAECEAR